MFSRRSLHRRYFAQLLHFLNIVYFMRRLDEREKKHISLNTSLRKKFQELLASGKVTIQFNRRRSFPQTETF